MSKRVLVIAAHPDDEVIGLGGTLARHLAQGDFVTAAIIADVGSARYNDDMIQATRHSCLDVAKQLGFSDVRFASLDDQKLDVLPILGITQWIASVMEEVKPQIIYTHHRGDINRDHTVVHEATLTAARPYSAPYVERILCYEAPSATEWAGPYPENSFLPNIYVNITSHIDSKLNVISTYTTELRPFPHPRSIEAIRTRAAYWGSVIGVPAAEPFVLVREIVR